MRQYIYHFAFVLALSAGIAIAQTPSQQQDRPSTMPPVVSSDTPQQNPDQMPQTPANPDRSTPAPVSPDEDKPPSSQTSTMTRGTASSQAQSQIQEALQRQMQSGAGNVTVSVAGDNSIQLTGTVASDDQKKQAEQIARQILSSRSQQRAAIAAVSRVDKQSIRGLLRRVVEEFRNDLDAAARPDDREQHHEIERGPQDALGKRKALPAAGIKSEPMLADSSITVDTTERSIDLSGTVTSKAAEDKVLEIARANAGGRKVIDHLRVTTKPF